MVLRERDFGLLWVGQLISKLGSQFNYIALAWMMLQATGSGVATGGVYLSQVLPGALFGWIAGVWVDRTDRRRMMIACDWLRGAVVLVLPVAWLYGAMPSWLVYAVTFVVSALTLLFFACEKSVIPDLVPSHRLTEANAYAEMTEQAAALAGPVVAGILIAALPSPVYILFIDAASFALSALTLLFMHWREHRPPPPATSARDVLQEAAAGVRYLLKDRFLRIVFCTATAVNLLVAPFTVVFPVFSERVLHAGSVGFGWLMGGIGGGMLLGSVSAAWLAERVEKGRLIYIGMAMLGIAFACMAGTDSLPLATALAALAGFGVAPANALMMTMIQEKTPPAMQGRVFASLLALVGMAIPLGVAIVSPLLDLWRPSTLLLLMGGLTVVVAATGYISIRSIEPRRT